MKATQVWRRAEGGGCRSTLVESSSPPQLSWFVTSQDAVGASLADAIDSLTIAPATAEGRAQGAAPEGHPTDAALVPGEKTGAAGTGSNVVGEEGKKRVPSADGMAAVVAEPNAPTAATAVAAVVVAEEDDGSGIVYVNGSSQPAGDTEGAPAPVPVPVPVPASVSASEPELGQRAVAGGATTAAVVAAAAAAAPASASDAAPDGQFQQHPSHPMAPMTLPLAHPMDPMADPMGVSMPPSSSWNDIDAPPGGGGGGGGPLGQAVRHGMAGIGPFAPPPGGAPYANDFSMPMPMPPPMPMPMSMAAPPIFGSSPLPQHMSHAHAHAGHGPHPYQSSVPVSAGLSVPLPVSLAGGAGMSYTLAPSSSMAVPGGTVLHPSLHHASAMGAMYGMANVLPGAADAAGPTSSAGTSTSTTTVGAGAGGFDACGPAAALHDLEPFIFPHDRPSRAIVLCGVSRLPAEALHAECARHGQLLYLIVEFQQRYGVVFAAYSDMRSARRAYYSLAPELSRCDAALRGEPMHAAGGKETGGGSDDRSEGQHGAGAGASARAGAGGGVRASSSDGGGRGGPLSSLAAGAVGPAGVTAHYCVPLTSTSALSEHVLIVRELPIEVMKLDIHTVFSSYGQVAQVTKRAAGASAEFVVEYFDVDDARRAVSELSGVGGSSASGLPSVVQVAFAEREPEEVQCSHRFFALLTSWRHQQLLFSAAAAASGLGGGAPPVPSPAMLFMNFTPRNDNGDNASNAAATVAAAARGSGAGGRPGMPGDGAAYHPARGGHPAAFQHPHAHPYAHHPHMGGMAGMYGGVPMPNGGVGVVPHGTMLSPIEAMMSAGSRSQQLPMPQPSQRVGHRRGGGGHGGGGGGGGGGGDDGGSRGERNGGGGGGGGHEFSVDIERVLSGSDQRTTVMIRNIPNKYTQLAVLEEINTRYKGSYDFFYLPIDFKNKCNVGYAFINFINHEVIVPFHREFAGRRWNNFNSEKVCALTYARIQGKSSMISRFQNSSLMEKNVAYQPLLFYSYGTMRGQPEPFPTIRESQMLVKQQQQQQQQQQHGMMQ